MTPMMLKPKRLVVVICMDVYPRLENQPAASSGACSQRNSGVNPSISAIIISRLFCRLPFIRLINQEGGKKITDKI